MDYGVYVESFTTAIFMQVSYMTAAARFLWSEGINRYIIPSAFRIRFYILICCPGKGFRQGLCGFATGFRRGETGESLRGVSPAALSVIMLSHAKFRQLLAIGPVICLNLLPQ